MWTPDGPRDLLSRVLGDLSLEALIAPLLTLKGDK